MVPSIVRSLALALLLQAGFGPAALALPTVPSGFTAEVLAAGLSNPTAMEFAPDGRLFVTQQGGSLRVVKNGTLLILLCQTKLR